MTAVLAVQQPSPLQMFEIHGHPWRFGRDERGRPYAVAADVAKSFDYATAKDALRLLDEDEKGRQILPTPGGPQEMLVVFKDGIWELIFRSSKPEAKAIKKRVKAILDEIEKTGRFQVEQIGDTLDALEAQAQRTMAAIAIAKEERALRLEAQAQVVELAPDAARARQTMDAHGMALVGTVAKRFGIKERALRDFMHADGLLIRGGSRHNEPHADHVKKGYFAVKTTTIEPDPDGPPIVKSTTYVTPKGEALVWKRLFDAGMVKSRQMPGGQLALISA